MPWNDSLDPGSTAYQIAASQELRIRVLAGPGAGKSFAMKRRVARLLEDDNLTAEQVLAVTFTRVEVAEVRVMSLHKSKGLSSRYVFIVGCVEGLIPSRPEAGTPQDIARAKLEEDRRLFYVGLTRVKASPETGHPGYLAITYPMRMPAAEAFRSQIAAVTTQGNVAVLRASRFLAQLGPTAPAPAVGAL